MMEKFVNRIKNINPTSNNLAEQWVRAAEEQINETIRRRFKPNQNMYNAVGIGVTGNVIHVWALDKSSSPKAKEVWQFTIP